MSQESKTNGSRTTLGFGLVLAGLAASYLLAGGMVVRYIATNSWVEVAATIHDVKLVENRGDSENQGDSTTYSIHGNYSYIFDDVEYHNDRISLSYGSDSLGSYWQDLERSLNALKKSNEASAFVNPSDPKESVLDRTLRWESIVFGSFLLIIFCGAGGFITWTALRGEKSREARLQLELSDGIKSYQKTDRWITALFGSLFFVVGVGMSVFVLPDAIRNGEYGALFLLLFVFTGAGFLYYAFKLNRAYRLFGPTPLFLNPSVASVGGQLGGRFSLNVQNVNHSAMLTTQPLATLACTRKTLPKRRSSSSIQEGTSYTVLWQEERPVYLKQTARGVDASFVFDVPNSCTATQKLSEQSFIVWRMTVEGDFSTSGLGKFERNWAVVVEENAAQASHELFIPQGFLGNAQRTTQKLAKTSALEQVTISEDSQCIKVHSKAARAVDGGIVGMLLGTISIGSGFFMYAQDSWFGYLFIFLGGVIFNNSFSSLGIVIEAKIDKHSRVLNTKESWFGLVYAKHQGNVHDPEQFIVKRTEQNSGPYKKTEYYAVEFESNDKTIRIADEIEGEKGAMSVVDAIAKRCA